MRKRRHPLSGAIYEVDPDGTVRVDDHGVAGVFTPEGDWVSGELRHADPHLCSWLAGRQLPASLQRNPKDMHPDVARQATGAAR